MIKVFSNKGEYWKQYSDKGNLYKVLVSSFGRVVDMDFISKPLHDNGNGYFTFSVTGCVRYIHRAVAQMFLDGDNSLQVNHKDGNKAHNNVENLEWVTGSSNIKHAHKSGLMKKRTENGNINILSEDQVIFLYTEVKKCGKGISETAVKMGIPRTTASSIINKRSRSDITDKLDISFQKCLELS